MSIYATWNGGGLHEESGHGDVTYSLWTGDGEEHDKHPGWTTEAGVTVNAYEMRVDERTYAVTVSLLIGEDLFLNVPLSSLLRAAPAELMAALTEGAMELADEVRDSLTGSDDDDGSDDAPAVD